MLNSYSQDNKKKLDTEICCGTCLAVLLKREKVSVQSLNNWKENNLFGEDINNINQSEITDLRKILSKLSVLYSEAIFKK